MSNRKQTSTGRIPRKVKANTFDTRFNPLHDDTLEHEKKEPVNFARVKPIQGQGTIV
ncbi:hypothetical protein Lwal_1373 [Legionella waltersii]|uniref:Uncharacterized protein n=2 Tax=Legionella waltersii TaxID=66969 RepID=A0A0W1AD78_9GAMM|nr:hypothetical protein Lwal_1373 [Legionella waltersii]SNV12965.1 Uncharacterised protein [Legionella waltersii]